MRSVHPSATSTAIERSSVSPEKDAEDAKNDPSITNVVIVDHDDYPDGGLRAWLIVLGVCVRENVSLSIF